MYTVQDFVGAVDAIAPFSYAEKWDNVGLLVGGTKQPASRALVALDVTPEVLQEAIDNEVDVIVTHHPVIFAPLKRLDAASLPFRLAAAGIAVISAHTNLDIVEGGVNDALASALQLAELRPLSTTETKNSYKLITFVPKSHTEAVYQALAQAGAGKLGSYSHCAYLSQGQGRFQPLADANPFIGEHGKLEKVEETRLEMLVPPDVLSAVLAALAASHPYETPAYDLLPNHAVQQELALGRIGKTEQPLLPLEFAQLVKEQLNVGGIRFVAGNNLVQTVAVCGGSGSDFIGLAAAKGADALVTSEVKHHQWLEAREAGITLVDAGHFSTECVGLPYLAEQLAQRLPGAEIHLAQTLADPVSYL